MFVTVKFDIDEKSYSPHNVMKHFADYLKDDLMLYVDNESDEDDEYFVITDIEVIPTLIDASNLSEG